MQFNNGFASFLTSSSWNSIEVLAQLSVINTYHYACFMAVDEECVNKLMTCQIKEEFQECLSWLGHETHYKLKTAVQRQSIIPNYLLIGMRLEDVFPQRIFHAPWLETGLCILRPLKMPASARFHVGMHTGLSPASCPLCSYSTSLGRIFVSHHFDLQLPSRTHQSLHF